MRQKEQFCDILIKDPCWIGGDGTLHNAECIAIKDGSILHIGECADWTGANTFSSQGLVWMPGLVDGHTHTSQQLLRGGILDATPPIWRRINIPFEAKLTEENAELSAAVCALEMIRSGTTGFIDAGGRHLSQYLHVYRQSGLRAMLSYMTTDAPFIPESLRTTAKEGLERQISLQKELSKDANGLLRAVYSMPGIEGVSEEMVRCILTYAKENHLPTEVHMNEYASGVENFVIKHGIRPYEWLERENLIGDHFIAAHNIFLAQSEIDIIKRRHVRVVHCPFSNCGKGIPPTPQLLAEGASVAFGSDGSGHGGVDLFREIRLFRSIMNARYGVHTADSRIISAAQLLKIATEGGADALGIPGLGKIDLGAPADLIAINMDAPHLYPTCNPINTIVESACGSDILHMIVDGKIVMKNRQVLTLDEEKIMFCAHRYMDNLSTGS